jgi:hypothetical protein
MVPVLRDRKNVQEEAKGTAVVRKPPHKGRAPRMARAIIGSRAKAAAGGKETAELLRLVLVAQQHYNSREIYHARI